MKKRLWKYKKIAAGFLVLILAAECRFFHQISNCIYEWQKKNAGRQIMELVESEFFTCAKGEYGQVYFTSHDKAYAQMILSMVDWYYPVLSADFGCLPEKEIIVVVYPERKLLCQAVGAEENEMPMGAYYGGILNILSPEIWLEGEQESTKIDRFLEEGPMVHEMVHLVMDQKLKGSYDLWFTEGVALYYEKKYTGFEWRPDLKEMSAGITLEDLKHNFRLLNEAKAYRRSYDLIADLAEEKGEEALQSMITQMSQGKPFEKLYQAKNYN